MDNQTKLRIGGLLVLTTAVLSLIIVLIVDSWPLAILLAVIIAPQPRALSGLRAASSASFSNA